ncbi:unnamed protein product [Durusdinium trenchii]|uniref:Receptor ligand binding region domain-containing protein n=2 Tax=Durusdinium trenchii TaxID=1381693 RepID=A0ABP0P003_9DINO
MIVFKAHFLLPLLQLSAVAVPERGLKVSHHSDGLVVRRLSDDPLHTLHTVETLNMEASLVVLEFVHVARGGYTSSSFSSLLTAIEMTQSDLTTGNPSKHLVAPPNAETAAQLQHVVDTTNSMHAFLRGNIGSVASTSTAVLTNLDTSYKALVEEYDQLIVQYQAYAKMAGIAEKQVEAYAYRLLSYSVRLAVECSFILLNIAEAQHLEELQGLQVLFSSLLESIIWGNVVADLPDLTNVCPLQKVLTVSKIWFEFETQLQPVRNLETSVSSEGIMDSVCQASLLLRATMQAFIDQLDQPDCNPLQGMDAALWRNGIQEVNRFRQLVAKAARIYMQALATRASDSSQDEELLGLTKTMSDGQVAIANAYKGSYLTHVPVAPTQELVELLKTVYDAWLGYKRNLERVIQKETSISQEHMTNQSFELDRHLEEVGILYVRAASNAGESRAILWQLIQQNRAMLESLAKEALIISVGDTAQGKTDKFDLMAMSFEKTHSELLRGAGGSALAAEVPVPRTTDACILSTMAKVKTDYEALKSILIQMYGSKDFLNSHLGFIAAEAASPVLVDAFLAFKRGWDEFRPSDALRMRDLQIAYIYANPNAVGSKDNLDHAQGDEYYHLAHQRYHPTYRAILYERNYYDIFIFDLQGNLIYSVYKELDYATNFLAHGSGEWKDSGLGEAFRAAVRNPDIINIIDWKPYGPSSGALASFLSTGIKQDGQLIGVFCTQMPPESKPVEVREMQPFLQTAISVIDSAVASYAAGYGTCNIVLDARSWEIMMEETNQLRWRFFKTSTEFALLTHGFSQSWLNASAMGLEEHKNYLVIEASESGLADALWNFKQAWDAFRETDAERLLSLQIAYILLNPFPTGEKDKLNRADGIEEYHAVHAQYHPTYRAILYDHNYYDIFFFDMGGNLIYSVYKELDYATNFLADGPGEWKDSGLGEAFRAAVANPDGINVVDWKPYGPSNGALASFLSTGVRRAGQVIGVFCTQLPPEFTPRNSSSRLQETVEELQNALEDFKFGERKKSLNPPATQEISDELFQLSDTYESIRGDLLGAPSMESLNRILGRSDDFDRYASRLSDAVQERAYQQEPSLQGAKMRLAAENLAIMQKIQRNLVLIYVGGFDSLRVRLITSMTRFEHNQALLREGNLNRRLAMNDIQQTGSFEGLQLLDAVDTAWTALKPTVQSISQGLAVDQSALKGIVELADDAIEASQAVNLYFSTTTRTTTMLALEVLTPLPLTGSWAAGTTFRLAARLAEGIINQDQLLLPGYRLQHVFFDDKCDESVASDVVVSAMAAKDTYVAIGGMGCDQVCRSISSLATSLRLPFVSYECASPDFSDTIAYPALARMGTVTTPGFLNTVQALKAQNDWKHLFVISGDPAYYQVEMESYTQSFQDMGFSVQTLSAYENRWNDIEGRMATVKGSTSGMERVILVLGSETFFRKLICASITQGLQSGIVWLSTGTWRGEWWKKTDLLTSAHRQWLREDVLGLQLKQAFAALKSAWDDYSPSVETTRQALIDLYVTDQKDELLSVEGTQKYHEVHVQYHPTYRKKLYDRGYYDIFFFNLEGDLIYSVFKETDYGTNFKASGSGPWKDSGLGQAFRGALQDPDNLTYIDWQPYGPSANAPAAFFSTGLRDEDGVLVGIYSIQLPPEYERSIEDLQPSCSFEKITEAYQGAVNVAGFGRPIEENIEKPLPCFKGYSPRSFLSLLALRFDTGYPVGELSTRVEDPYVDVKAHAVDATCAFAFGIQYLLRQGHSVEQIQRRDPEVYRKFSEYLRTELDFEGTSGQVKFEGNDRKNLQVVQQVVNGVILDMGLISENGTSITWISNGTTNLYWQDEPAEALELMWILHPLAMIFAIGCPCLCGCVLGYSIRAVMQKRSNAQ